MLWFSSRIQNFTLAKQYAFSTHCNWPQPSNVGRFCFTYYCFDYSLVIDYWRRLIFLKILRLPHSNAGDNWWAVVYVASTLASIYLLAYHQREHWWSARWTRWDRCRSRLNGFTHHEVPKEAADAERLSHIGRYSVSLHLSLSLSLSLCLYVSIYLTFVIVVSRCVTLMQQWYFISFSAIGLQPIIYYAVYSHRTSEYWGCNN